jgi:hypothetical protein
MEIYLIQHTNLALVWFDLFVEMAVELKEKYSAKITHKADGHLYIEKFNYNLPDCEIIIYDEENDILKAISWSETRSGLLDVFNNRSNKDDIFIVTQFHGWFPKDFDRSSLPYTLKASTYYPFYSKTNYDFYYHLRKFRGYDNLIDKLFCLETTGRDDVPRLRDIGLCSESPGTLSIDNYLELAIKHKIGLSIHGVSEVCHREFDYMAIGLPNLRLEYMTQLDAPLIPNYHYISIPRDGFPWDGRLNREGGDQYVEAYKQRFLEVKDDIDFLEFVSKNAHDYYLEYCSPHNKLKHILGLLNL